MKRKNKVLIISILLIVFSIISFLFLMNKYLDKEREKKIVYKVEYDNELKEEVIKKDVEVSVERLGIEDNEEIRKEIHESENGWVKHEKEGLNVLYFMVHNVRPMIKEILYDKGKMEVYYMSEVFSSDTDVKSFLVELKTDKEIDDVVLVVELMGFENDK